jgi:hypothetical protein
MADFTRHLFDVCKSAPAEVAQAIERGLGVEQGAGEGLGMNWSLRTIVCERA